MKHSEAYLYSASFFWFSCPPSTMRTGILCSSLPCEIFEQKPFGKYKGSLWLCQWLTPIELLNRELLYKISPAFVSWSEYMQTFFLFYFKFRRKDTALVVKIKSFIFLSLPNSYHYPRCNLCPSLHHYLCFHMLYLLLKCSQSLHFHS